ncbi:hypothetical protein B0J13DRAFT_629422 [Dactylonectria estremocensis]|uniref:Uncharacterized protein n=1 Tax=Dactylonectria estremocensis TaxID=1079267 RepID=A0A9P9IHW4_9HYPO|nr:hypothetical protein B0J13DRAFT_629422 [Dactylonectria estremocensis]
MSPKSTPQQLQDDIISMRNRQNSEARFDRLGQPVVQVKAKNVGPGAAAAPDDKAENLAK